MFLLPCFWVSAWKIYSFGREIRIWCRKPGNSTPAKHHSEATPNTPKISMFWQLNIIFCSVLLFTFCYVLICFAMFVMCWCVFDMCLQCVAMILRYVLLCFCCVLLCFCRNVQDLEDLYRLQNLRALQDLQELRRRLCFLCTFTAKHTKTQWNATKQRFPESDHPTQAVKHISLSLTAKRPLQNTYFWNQTTKNIKRHTYCLKLDFPKPKIKHIFLKTY